MGERPVPDIVQKTGDAKRLDDEPFGRNRLAGDHERGSQRRIERAGPDARLVHDPETVREPRMLGRRKDPAGALELTDPSQSLDPGRVEQILFGDVLGRQTRGVRLRPREPLRQLDVAVDRVANEVDRDKRVTGHQRLVAGEPAGAGATAVPYRSAARRWVAATSSRNEAGASTSVSSPHDSTHSRISIVPATVARQTSEPSLSTSTRCDGCQRASWTRAATAGEKRTTTSTGSWSAMLSQARSNID